MSFFMAARPSENSFNGRPSHDHLNDDSHFPGHSMEKPTGDSHFDKPSQDSPFDKHHHGNPFEGFSFGGRPSMNPLSNGFPFENPLFNRSPMDKSLFEGTPFEYPFNPGPLFDHPLFCGRPPVNNRPTGKPLFDRHPFKNTGLGGHSYENDSFTRGPSAGPSSPGHSNEGPLKENPSENLSEDPLGPSGNDSSSENSPRNDRSFEHSPFDHPFSHNLKGQNPLFSSTNDSGFRGFGPRGCGRIGRGGMSRGSFGRGGSRRGGFGPHGRGSPNGVGFGFDFSHGFGFDHFPANRRKQWFELLRKTFFEFTTANRPTSEGENDYSNNMDKTEINEGERKNQEDLVFITARDVDDRHTATKEEDKSENNPINGMEIDQTEKPKDNIKFRKGKDEEETDLSESANELKKTKSNDKGKAPMEDAELNEIQDKMEKLL